MKWHEVFEKANELAHFLISVDYCNLVLGNFISTINRNQVTLGFYSIVELPLGADFGGIPPSYNRHLSHIL